MFFRPIRVSLALALIGASSPAFATDPDFKAILSSPSGASGLAAAISSLGQCNTKPEWTISYDPDTDKENPNHVYVGCQYDPDWEEGNDLYDKGVLAKFIEAEGVYYLESLTSLP
ncbi:hypothetical protein [Roseibium sp. SCP14]|uniref:hypothetical protein n=1 Tax=Roseibium sp. SCP14 TaxID=3141375 RepID=UPI003338E94B